MKVHWSQEAVSDSNQIWEYLVEKNPAAAVKMDELFEAAADRLAEFPYMGQEGKITGTREVFPHENYRMVYTIQSGAVWILTLIHTSQLWPKKSKGKQKSHDKTL